MTEASVPKWPKKLQAVARPHAKTDFPEGSLTFYYLRDGDRGVVGLSKKGEILSVDANKRAVAEWGAPYAGGKTRRWEPFYDASGRRAGERLIDNCTPGEFDGELAAIWENRYSGISRGARQYISHVLENGRVITYKNDWDIADGRGKHGRYFWEIDKHYTED